MFLRAFTIMLSFKISRAAVLSAAVGASRDSPGLLPPPELAGGISKRARPAAVPSCLMLDHLSCHTMAYAYRYLVLLLYIFSL